MRGDIVSASLFNRFLVDYGARVEERSSLYGSLPLGMKSLGYEELMSRYAGFSFLGGIYRLHSQSSQYKLNELVESAFPDYVGRVFVFGYDWLGRQFSLDFGRVDGGEPQVLMYEPGTGQVLEIPCGFSEFHNVELVEYSEEALAAEAFGQWSTVNPSLSVSDCVGYSVPLFLGGEDDVSNMELCNLEMYWHICGQLIVGARKLPPGMRISQLSIGE